MRNVISICKREILSFFVSPVAYFVITGWILLGAYFFFALLEAFNLNIRRMQMNPYSPPPTFLNLNQWVVEGFYQTLIVVLVFLIPLLTMRIIAEEKKRGTFELLLTSPLTIGEIVYGKFLSVAFMIFVMMLCTFAFPLLLMVTGQPTPEFYPMLSGIIGMFLCALAFASVGMAASSFTENQIVAGITSLVVLLILYVIHAFAESAGGVGQEVLEYLSPVLQVRDMLRGVLSIKAIVYFLSLIAFGLFVSQRALDAYRWR